MDILSDVLRCVRLTGAVFFDMRAHAPWVGTTPRSSVIASMVMPEAEHVICFHIVMSGSGWAALEDSSMAPAEVHSGDVIIISKGDLHYLSSSPGMRGEADLAVFERTPGRPLLQPHVLNESAEGPEACHFVCGYLGCDLRPFNPLLEGLPRLLISKASTLSQGWLSSLLSIAFDETSDDGAGRQIMLAKVAELIFVDVLRQHVRELSGHSRGWFSGLRDRHVAEALRLIHSRPAEDWTLESLAREAGVSRSALAERFTTLVGVPAIEYLTRWRMQLAAKRLEQGMEIAETAVKLGYQSEATFNRAFKRVVGTTPGAWRKSRGREGSGV